MIIRVHKGKPDKYPYAMGWVFCGSCQLWLKPKREKEGEEVKRITRCPFCHLITRIRSTSSYKERQRVKRDYLEYEKRYNARTKPTLRKMEWLYDAGSITRSGKIYVSSLTGR